MFTRLRFQLPPKTGDVARDVDLLRRAIHDFLLSLEVKGALVIDEASIRAASGIRFPATQNASTDANTQDDYAESSTTPTPTAGSGAFTSVSSLIKATKIGDRVSFNASITITTNGTAASWVAVALPFTPAETAGCGGIDNAGLGLAVTINAAGLNIFKYDGTYPGANGKVLRVSGNYRV